MIVNIPFKEGDDKAFLVALNSLVASLVEEYKPKDLYIIRINKWFDHKWLNYSGMGVVQFPEKGVDPIRTGFWGKEGAALDIFYQDKITFPPFNPKQIGELLYWERAEDGTYYGGEKPKWPHRFKKPILQHSSHNLQNRVGLNTASGLFLWFSSNTEKNRYASIMTYLVEDYEVNTWYASIRDSNGWCVDKVKGINKERVQRVFPFG